MVRRSSKLKAFANLHVFPGGVAEPEDGPSSRREASKRCALRELFEETGVLLGAGRSAETASAVDFVGSTKDLQHRVAAQPAQFDALVRQQRVELPTRAMAHVATFITPVLEPRRFRTDFFVVVLDETAAPSVTLDETETVEFRWISPHDAIAENSNGGGIRFLPPQFFVLSLLARCADPRALVRDVTNRDELDDPLEILPEAIAVDEREIVLAYPGDEAHPDFPGDAGARHRLHGVVPVGNGFHLESTWGGPLAITRRDWAELEARRKRDGGGGDDKKNRVASSL